MFELFTRIEDAVTKLLLCGIVVLVFLAAIARSIGDPMIWSVDLAQLLFLWLSVLGANRAMRLKAHIGVDLFMRKVPRTPRWLIEIGLGLVTLAFLAVLAVTGSELTLMNWQRIYGDSGISYAWVTAAVPVGAVLIGLTVLQNLIGAFRSGALVFYADRAVDRSDSQLG
jgi:TRAP-type transport system small permease protein